MDGRLPCQGVRWGGVTMIHHQMKTPTDCTSLGDIRGAIDHVDRQIIALLGLRADYVHAAAKFKDSEAAVAAPERQAAMLQARRGWAISSALNECAYTLAVTSVELWPRRFDTAGSGTPSERS